MPDDVRVGDAEREHLAAVLGRHYVEGRLDADALGERLDVVLRARSRGEAVGVVADLPALASQPERRRRWRGRRHGEASAPRATWLPTTERFQDPTTQRVMRVWVDPGDRSRHYVAERGG